MALFVFTALLSITVGQVCVLYYAVGYGDLIILAAALTTGAHGPRTRAPCCGRRGASCPSANCFCAHRDTLRPGLDSRRVQRSS